MSNHLPGSVIAVVDDDPGILTSLEGLLQSMDYAVHTFGSAEALLASGLLGELHCVITDIGLPGLSGFDLLGALQARRPTLPVIFITGEHDRREQWPPLSTPPHSLFKKPFNCQALLTAVSDAVVHTREKNK